MTNVSLCYMPLLAVVAAITLVTWVGLCACFFVPVVPKLDQLERDWAAVKEYRVRTGATPVGSIMGAGGGPMTGSGAYQMQNMLNMQTYQMPGGLGGTGGFGGGGTIYTYAPTAGTGLAGPSDRIYPVVGAPVSAGVVYGQEGGATMAMPATANKG